MNKICKGRIAKTIFIGLFVLTTVFYQGNVKTVFGAGGTVSLNKVEDGAYEISLPEQLLAFSYLTSGNWATQTDFQILQLDGVSYNSLSMNAPAAEPGASGYLTSDIDLSGYANWIPIMGPLTGYYQGSFDGRGHTVSNLTINASKAGQGLFGGSSGSIKNVNVQGVLNTSVSQGMIGGICGYLSGGTVDNCQASCQLNGTSNIGGVVGYNNGGVVSNCSTTASNSVIGSSSHIGGVVGYNMTGATTTKCTNNGTVELRYGGTDASFAGGVVGRNYDGSTISNCTNNGNVSQTVGFGAVGGIVGNSTALNGATSALMNNTYVLFCTNNGVISNLHGKTGGIIGKNQAGSYYFGNINNGTVSASNSWIQVGNDEFPIVAFMNNISAGDDTYRLVGRKATDSTTFIMPSNPVRDGYTFLGWYTSRSGSEKMPGTVGSIPMGAIYYAQWDKIAEEETTTVKSQEPIITVNVVPIIKETAPTVSRGTTALEVKKGKTSLGLIVKTAKKTLMDLLFTAAEQDRMQEGRDATISLAVNSISKNEMLAMNKALQKRYKTREYIVINYFSLDLSKTIEGLYTKYITKTGRTVSLQFTIPKAQMKNRSGGTFKLVKMGKNSVYEMKDKDKRRDTITVKTRNFTTYAIIYLEETEISQ